MGAAAYRAGEKITNEYDGKIHDFTKKPGVVHTEILLPANAPSEYADRAVLWNAVERIEKAENAQLARDIEISLPAELTREQNISLAREYVKRHFVEKGMCADLCVHDKGDGNPHAHILLTMRPLEPDGRWGAKSRKEYILDDKGQRIVLPSGEFKSRKINAVDWNDRTKAEEWRQGWADAVNAALKRHGIETRVDHRSYERQGIDQKPTIHLGVAAAQMERKGIATDRGNINREINSINKEIRQTRARIRKVKDWLYAVPVQNTPTMVEMMTGVAGGKNLETRWQKIADLKTRANVLIFLQSNHITGIAQLAEKVSQIHERLYEVSNKVKPVERRLAALAEHLSQYDSYKQHRAVYDQYRQLDPKKRDAFKVKHSGEIQSYEAAKKYLDAVMNGKTTIPIKTWQAERDKLTAEKYALSEEYYTLKDEVKSVEVLRKGAESLMREDTQRTQPQRTQGMEL